MDLENKIFAIQNEEEFTEVALEIFSFQYANNSIYKEFVDLTGNNNPASLEEITFLPISFFKTSKVLIQDSEEEIIFKSSGTAGDRSNHFVSNLELYRRSFLTSYESFIGNPVDQVILALLPNYVEQGDSSLVYMVNQLINKANDLSGFVLNNIDEIGARYTQAVSQGKQVVIFGVSYALLDLVKSGQKFNDAIIIETGGMKGKRDELTKQQLHDELREGLATKTIYSEYGMTELLSQAYASDDMIFQTPTWMKVMLRDPNDPLTIINSNKTGGINIIDLANINSCSFIATQDLGKMTNNGFELLGRFDNSDIRGCNLLFQ